MSPGASQARLQILDANNRLVRDFELSTRQTFGKVKWNGKSSEGVAVPTGAYRVVIAAQDANGKPILGGEVFKGLKVEAVRYQGQEPMLWAEEQQFSLSDLRGITEE